MKNIVISFFLLAAALAAAGEGLPDGWYKIGDGSMKGYEVFVEPDAGINGSGVRISKVDEIACPTPPKRAATSSTLLIRTPDPLIPASGSTKTS